MDPRVDDYISTAPEYARPILEKLRAIVRDTCPDAVETIKWRIPAYEYKGLLCGLAGLKSYAALVFFKGKLMPEAEERLANLHSVKDLPPKKEIVAYLKQAMKLNEDGVQPARRKHEKLPVPPALAKALRTNAKARRNFQAFAPSHQREYIQWIQGAKREETRERRIAEAVAMLAAGKSRNWKYGG
jgi:uncharacterized protein YdeI (YjbR/CyaY-like superfamily)